MVVSASFTDKTESLRIENDVVKYILADISVALITYGQLAYGTARVGKIQVEPVLVAVQRHDGKLVRVLCETDTRNISPLFQRKIDFAGYFGFDIKSMYGYF